MNKTITLGRLVKDPELRTASNGQNVYTVVAIASNEGFGEKQVTDYIKYTFFGKTAENLCKHAQKGTLILVEGKLSNNSWVDKDGNSRFELQAIAKSFEFINSWSCE
ncbi:hypothetical protein fh0823_23970 [Francisella halioticida]|uniref:single-stranded DNA-binding protein n=1 Tax=Francisella halioticida TaxID=549298 RepID=UPI001AF91F4E|nr:single-stranded DNA-binding protein [Francisella halioticida]BCD92258.1 hypothetical protein fh0823_23970 [Francisella halioticida]